MRFRRHQTELMDELVIFTGMHRTFGHGDLRQALHEDAVPDVLAQLQPGRPAA